MQLALVDGTIVYPLDGYIHLGNDGLGLPPVSIIEQAGPLQDGALYLSTRLQPRTIRLVLLLSGLDQIDYWQQRNALMRMFRPGRQLTLQATLPDGSEREIDVVYSGGLSFPSSDKRGLTHKVICELRASDPIWRSKFPLYESFGSSLNQHPFVIPLVTPVSIGLAQLDETALIQYAGSWPSSPIIRMYGPITNPQIVNVTTGKKIVCMMTINPNEYIEIDTRYGRTSVIDHNGQSQLSSLSIDSDLSGFAIVPNPLAPNGENEIRVRGEYATAQTNITIEYREHYIGI